MSSAEKLTTGPTRPSGTNSQPGAVSVQ